MSYKEKDRERKRDKKRARKIREQSNGKRARQSERGKE